MSNIETLINHILNGTAEDFIPKSRVEEYLKNIMNGTGVDGLPLPQSRLDALFYSLAEKMEGGSGGETVNKLPQLVNGTITKITAKDLAGVTKFYQYVLYRCHSLESIEIPDSVTSIEKFALSDCIVMKNLTIGNSVQYIGEYAFKYCVELEKVVIPDSVTTIKNNAFYDCVKLTDITISSNITSIESNAFVNNTTNVPIKGYATIRMRATTPPTIQADTFDSNTAKFIVPKGSLSLYKTATNWSRWADIMEEEL